METQDTIDAYVKGQLSAAERSTFETALRNDPALAEAVEHARLDLQVANVLIEDEVRGWMQEWGKDPTPPAAPPGRSNPLRWLPFMVIILAVGGGIWLFNRTETPKQLDGQTKPEEKNVPQQQNQVDPNIVQQQQQTNPVQTPPVKTETLPADARYLALAERNFKGGDNSSYIRKIDPGQTAPPDLLQQAAEAINKKDYSQAIKLLSALPTTHPDYTSAQVLLGESYFGQKQFAKAEQAYTKALKSGKISADAVEWNLLMSYLAQYNTRKNDFDRLLKKILADTDHPDHEQAVKLQTAVQ